MTTCVSLLRNKSCRCVSVRACEESVTAPPPPRARLCVRSTTMSDCNLLLENRRSSNDICAERAAAHGGHGSAVDAAVGRPAHLLLGDGLVVGGHFLRALLVDRLHAMAHLVPAQPDARVGLCGCAPARARAALRAPELLRVHEALQREPRPLHGSGDEAALAQQRLHRGLVALNARGVRSGGGHVCRSAACSSQQSAGCATIEPAGRTDMIHPLNDLLLTARVR
jgi:hypothetical protein